MKNQVIILPNGNDIVDVVPGEPGPKSDINILRESKKNFAPNQKFSADKAYQGDTQTTTPQKKTKGGNLTSLEKENNKELSKTRVFVEHIIRVIKTFKSCYISIRLPTL